MDPKEYLNLLEKALLDILDGTSAGDIQSITGMKLERSIEIVNLIPIIEEQRKLKTNSEGIC